MQSHGYFVRYLDNSKDKVIGPFKTFFGAQSWNISREDPNELNSSIFEDEIDEYESFVTIF